MKKFIPLIIGIVLGIIGFVLWTNNQGSSLKDEEEFFKSLCEDGQKTIARIQDQYTRTEGTVVNMVSYKYDYYVDGIKYTEEVSTDKLPSTTEFEITYMPNNPSVSSKSNVCGTYERIKNDTSSSALMYVGIAFFFIGLLIVRTSFKKLVRK